MREPLSPSQEAFLARFDGLVVGQRAANGIFEGRSFRHPDFNIFIEFPEKWNLENTPQQVAAAAPDGDVLVLFRAVAEGNDPMDGARALEKASKSPVVAQTQQTTIGTLPAARTQVGVDSKVKIDLTWVAHAGRIYQVAGIAPTRRFDAVRPLFEAVAQSFRSLSPEERDAVREKRIRLVKARAGESLDALIARSNSSWKKDQVAVANALVGNEQLKEGQIIKVAVAEPYVARTR